MADAPEAEGGVDPKGDYPFRFTCRRSGNCCSIPGGIVRVTPDEITAIAEFLQITEDATRSRYVHPSGTRLREGHAHRCVFLDDFVDGESRASCRIYPVRPDKCRTWPFWPELRENFQAVQRARRMCPGIELLDADRDRS